MTDFFPVDQSTWLIAAGVILALLIAWLIYRRSMAGDRLQRILDDISYDRVDGILIPNGDDGEIQIDHLLLTSRGLLIAYPREARNPAFRES